MRAIRMIVSTALLILVSVSIGCLWKKAPTEPPVATSPNLITIEAGSYSFKPKVIKLDQPGPYILQVVNTTGSENNLTLKDPSGNLVKSVTIGAKQTGISNVELTKPGTYRFYGDKRFRSTLGMKGRIEVGAAK